MATKLSPLEETLFQAWARANGVDNHDDPNNYFDHRGLYKQSNGTMQLPGVVRGLADAHNAAMEPDEASGDMADPFGAQAEMHAAQLKADADRAKLALEHKKLGHTSMENEKDRQHDLMIEQMKAQAKAQADEANRQAQAEQAQADRQMAAQQSQVDSQQAQTDHSNGLQSTMLQELLKRSAPQPAARGQ